MTIVMIRTYLVSSFINIPSLFQISKFDESYYSKNTWNLAIVVSKIHRLQLYRSVLIENKKHFYK